MTAECSLTDGNLTINRVGYTPAGVAATEAHDAVYMNDAAYLDDVSGLHWTLDMCGLVMADSRSGVVVVRLIVWLLL